MSTSNNGKMTMRERLAYSFGAFGNDSFYGLLCGYLIMFITSHLFDTGNKALDNKMISAVTLIIMCLRFIELFIDPFIGNAIDRTKTRWGHFRPWVVIGGTVSAVILLLLFTNMGGLYKKSAIGYLVLFAVLYITMDIFYSFKDVGFWSMLPSLTTSSREREKTATYARVGSAIGGGLVGILVMPAVLFFSAKGTSTGDDRGWFMFALIICFLALISAWGVGIFTREVNSSIRKNKQDTVGIVGIFKVLSGNDQLMWVGCAYLFYCVAINIVNSLEVYYFTYIMGRPKAFSIFSTINIALGIVATSLFPILSKKFSRKTLFTCALICLLCGLGLFAVAQAHNFKLLMFAVPAVLVVISIFVFGKKVFLSEEKHAEIVAQLEKTWGKHLDKGEKTPNQVVVPAPISGQLIKLADVDDETFSFGAAGDGFAIKPTDGRVFAPFDATVKQVFTTRHAVGLVSDDGVALLIHVGIGTVKLKGTGFVSYVENGQRVHKGQELIEFWDPVIKKAGLDDTVIVTVTNTKKLGPITIMEKAGKQVHSDDPVMEVDLTDPKPENDTSTLKLTSDPV